MVSHLHHLFTADTCQSSLHTVRWKERPLQGPRCQSLHVGPWGTAHAQPGLQRSRCNEPGCTRTFHALTGTLWEGRKRSVMHGMLATFLLGLSCASRRLAKEGGGHVRTGDRWCWWLRHAALSSALGRQCAGTVEADALAHTAGHQGQAQTGGPTSLGRTPRGRRTPREPGRGHDDKERPAILAWGRRPGGVGRHAPRDLTVKTVQQAADRAMQAGRTRSTDAASRSRLSTGSAPDAVHPTPKADARGAGHAQRAASLFSLRKPYGRVLRGLSTCNLPGYVGVLQCLRNFSQLTAFEQAEMIL